MARVLDKGNKATAEEAATYVDQIEKLEEEYESERGTFMAKAKKIREAQKAVLDDAKSQGVAKKLVNTIVKSRDYDKKSKKLRDDLEDLDKAFYFDIRKHLGDFADLPLGAAAVKASPSAKDPIAAHAEKEWDENDPANKGKAKPEAMH